VVTVVAFDAGILVLVVVVGLVMYPLGAVVLDYFSESYNTTMVAQGLGNPMVIGGFQIIWDGWQAEPILAILAAGLASIVVGNNRRAGG
jgi:hypothetical protein